MDLAEIFREG